MTTTTETSQAVATPQPSLRRFTGGLLIVEGLLLLAPLAILGSAINWPATLSEPAHVMLPMIHQQAGAVQLGYLIYLIYSILFWPVALLTARVVAGENALSPLLHVAVGFGIASAVARCLGIIRWLAPMPVLAAAYVDPAATPETQATLALIYRTLNDYAGAVGEVLGVSLFAGLWILLLSMAALRSGRLPRWLGIFGLVGAAALFSSLLELFGVDMGALLTVTVSVVQFWFLAAGVVLLRSQKQ